MLYYLFSGVAAKQFCTNVPVTKPAQADFLFLVDASGSMCSKIQGVLSGLNRFAAMIDSNGIDARFALMYFGGRAELRSAFSSDITTIQDWLGKSECNHGGQEASFEAIRIALSDPPFKDALKTQCTNCNNPVSMMWRSDAQKMIHATDEDSDLPVLKQYMMTNQSSSVSFSVNGYNRTTGKSLGGDFEPAFVPAQKLPWYIPSSKSFKDINQYYRTTPELAVEPSFQAEIQETATLLIANNVFLNSLINLDLGYDGWLSVSAFNPKQNQYYWKQAALNFSTNVTLQNTYYRDNVTLIKMQFGSHDLAVQNADYTNFNPDETLLNLQNNNQGRSLWGYVLNAKSQGFSGNMRVFDINVFAQSNLVSSQLMINAFYSQVVQTTTYLQQNCVTIPDDKTLINNAIASSTQVTETTTSSDFLASTSTVTTTVLSSSSVIASVDSSSSSSYVTETSFSSQTVTSTATQTSFQTTMMSSSFVNAPSSTIPETSTVTQMTTSTYSVSDEVSTAAEETTVFIDPFEAIPTSVPIMTANFINAADTAPIVVQKSVVDTKTNSTVLYAIIASMLVFASVVGYLIIKRKRRQAKIFHDMMLDNGNVGLLNPLYSEHGFKENPLFDSTSGDDMNV